jgi:hypothetical protein
MRRRQVIEIEDQPWCPRGVRDGGTDWLRFIADSTRMFSAIVPKLRAAMQAANTDKILDLCSGGGGAWLTLEADLAQTGPLHVSLSDKYPNVDAFRYMHAQSNGRIGFLAEEVDGTRVPAHLDGVRTIFSAFHHFPPELATEILTDAVRQRRAIVIVEPASNRWPGLVGMPLQIIVVLLLTPFVRPFRWTRLFWTYIVPAIPFLVFFDGTMSMLRIYMPDELRELVARVPGHETFTWDIGTTPIKGMPSGLTHLVGTPRPKS